jgi:hypothetical protein
LIAPSSVVFRHILEIHPIDSRHQGRWDANNRDEGQNLEHVILSYADQTDQASRTNCTLLASCSS